MYLQSVFITREDLPDALPTIYK